MKDFRLSFWLLNLLMFEAKLTDGNILRKIVDSIKELVTDVNLEVSPSGISI